MPEALPPDPRIPPIRDASRRLVRELGFLRPTLAGTELPASAVHALVEIGRAGPLRAAELAERLVLEKSSISRMLAKLVASGELAETPSPEDGRAKLLSLTQRGRATLARIDAFAEAQVAAALRRMPPAAAASLAEGLAAYAAALAACRREREKEDG
ncbi:MarR family transcriptional regulator [Siccirubricoccus sp. KC 17139]|uniref:MarR family transcriptional regulator n=1 Tax=Siccirubricoccus soli TaxID=2899147 RepID=A0ABT1D6Y8_9PROT|nr:MarR family transcriptional regulator [Siccirubricoccus soli]MCO6416954.1 MarR family transcriptional regulator [Siccirubricoccus soli]MCP2683089.1 MarR family transcriptional regulator [Siccirubricoccus soli]